jgi:hypothetical protein
MSYQLLQLSNSANWEQRYSTTRNAVSLGAGSAFAPIPSITVPILISSHIIVVYVNTASSKDTWYFGGLISQKINLGLTVGGLPDSDAVQKNRLYLNRLTLLVWPRIASTYAVEVEIPKWFRQVSITLWEYIGPVADSTENMIQDLKTDLSRIESKIDSL